jgi:uncharacterized protein (DUF2147 family)
MRLFGGVKLLAGLALVGASAAGAAAPGGLDGRWVTQTGNVEIIFGPCGSALCGTAPRRPRLAGRSSPIWRLTELANGRVRSSIAKAARPMTACSCRRATQ